MKAFVITLIRSLAVSPNGTRVALVRFSHTSSVVFHLDSYSTAEQAIQVTHNRILVINNTAVQLYFAAAKRSRLLIAVGERYAGNLSLNMCEI